MLRKGHGGQHKAPAMEERRKLKTKSGEKEREIDQVLLILDLKDGKL